MMKNVMKIAKGICTFVFGVFATLAGSVLVTFGAMKVYDAFWNPSNYSACLSGDVALALVGNVLVTFAMIVCVYHCDSVLKEIEKEELEKVEA